MKRLLLITILLTACIAAHGQGYTPGPGIPSGSTSFTPTFRTKAHVTDSLQNFYLLFGTKGYLMYTAPQINKIFASNRLYFSERYFEKPDSVILLKLDTLGTGPFVTNIPGYGLKMDTSKYFPKVLHANFSVQQNGDTIKFNGPFVANPLQGVFQSNPGARESSDFAVFGSGVNTSTNPKLLISDHSTVAYRAFMRGSTSATPLSGTDYSGFIIGDQDVTAAPGGSYSMFNQWAIKPVHVINTGGATIDSVYTLNILGPSIGGGVNGALKVKGGVTLLDLPTITGGTSLVVDAGGNVGTGSGGGGDFLPLVFPSDQIVSLNTHRLSIRDSVSTTDAIQVYPGTGNVGIHAAYAQTDGGYAMQIFNPAPSFGGYFLAGNFQIDGTGYAGTITKAPHDSSGYVATTEYVDLAVAAHTSGVSSVSGTTNRVTSTGGTTPVIDISSTFEALLEKVANKTTTTTLGTSNTLYPTQNAVKVYVDNAVSGYVPTTRTLTAGLGMQAIGDLSANRTISSDTAVLKSKAGALTDYNNLSARITTNTTNIATNTSNIATKLSASNFVYSETPSGTINSSNVTFTLANTPTGGTVRIYRNGVRTTAFSMSGGTITMSSAPLTGDTLLIDYMK